VDEVDSVVDVVDLAADEEVVEVDTVATGEAAVIETHLAIWAVALASSVAGEAVVAEAATAATAETEAVTGEVVVAATGASAAERGEAVASATGEEVVAGVTEEEALAARGGSENPASSFRSLSP
jgi:hypothetical protein